MEDGPQYRDRQGGTDTRSEQIGTATAIYTTLLTVLLLQIVGPIRPKPPHGRKAICRKWSLLFRAPPLKKRPFLTQIHPYRSVCPFCVPQLAYCARSMI